jgi:hypothetical protein
VLVHLDPEYARAHWPWTVVASLGYLVPSDVKILVARLKRTWVFLNILMARDGKAWASLYLTIRIFS